MNESDAPVSVNEPVAAGIGDNPEQILLRLERHSHLETCLEVLTERERLALLLRDVEDLPAEQVAEQLRCSKATVRSHIANARVKLRQQMERMKRKGIA